MLINEGIDAINPVKISWWLILFPGIFLTATLLSLNFLGDGLRDAFDPKKRRKENNLNRQGIIYFWHSHDLRK